MNRDNHDSDVSLPRVEPSTDFVRRVTDRVAELETIRQVSRTQKRQMGACVWACLLGGAFLGWAVTSSLLPPLWAVYYTVECFAGKLVGLGIVRYVPLAVVGIGVAALALLAVAQLRKVPALLRSTHA